MIDNKEINIKFINSKDQRYPTCGDFWETNNSYEIRITKQDDPKNNMLILIHELVEAYLCKCRGIEFEDIDKFDIKWNQCGGTDKADEPGNEGGKFKLVGKAPYYNEHRFAENIERQLALENDIDWFTYSDNLTI